MSHPGCQILCKIFYFSLCLFPTLKEELLQIFYRYRCWWSEKWLKISHLVFFTCASFCLLENKIWLSTPGVSGSVVVMDQAYHCTMCWVDDEFPCCCWWYCLPLRTYEGCCGHLVWDKGWVDLIGLHGLYIWRMMEFSAASGWRMSEVSA